MPVKQRQLDLLTRATLPLLVAVLVPWVRSDSGADHVARTRPAHPPSVASRVHGVTFARGNVRSTTGTHTSYTHGPAVAPAGAPG